MTFFAGALRGPVGKFSLVKVLMAVAAVCRFQSLGGFVIVAFIAGNFGVHTQKRKLCAAMVKIGHLDAAPSGCIVALIAIRAKRTFMNVIVAVTTLFVFYGTELQI